MKATMCTAVKAKHELTDGGCDYYVRSGYNHKLYRIDLTENVRISCDEEYLNHLITNLTGLRNRMLEAIKGCYDTIELEQE